MKQVQKILDYFIEYEWEHRLTNISLDKKPSRMNITWKDIQDIDLLKMKLNKKKKEKIEGVIRGIVFECIQRQEQVLSELEKAWTSANDIAEISIEKILFQRDYKYPDNYSKDIGKIQAILQDDRIMVLYPVLAKGERKIPLICFEMELSKEGLKVQRYHLQVETLRVMVAAILKCEIPEVEIAMEDFKGFYQALTVLKNQDCFKIIDIINEELRGKFFEYGFKDIWEFKDYNYWAVTEEIILTMESFEDMTFPPFQEEIVEVRRQCEQSVPTILAKYLLGNQNRKSSENVQYVFWDGSYNSDFSINDKQAKVVSSYQNTQLLSVNGPPGTGKTTVLKEIIADNIVKKTKQLLSVWDQSWRSIGKGNQQVYVSPLNGACEHSILITSVNNKAVNNIGVELLKEIEYFSDVICENEQGYRGILCAKLGNMSNMAEFKHIVLNPLIEFLKNVRPDEEKTVECKSEFCAIEKEMSQYKKFISAYLHSRERICEQLKNMKLVDEKFAEENIRKSLTEVDQTISQIENGKQKSEDDIRSLQESISQIVQDFLAIEKELEEDEKELKEKENNLQEIEEKSKCIFIGNILKKLAERKLGTKESINQDIEELTESVEFKKKAKKQKQDEFDKKEKECKEEEEFINQYEVSLKEENKKKSVLEEWIKLKVAFDDFSQLYSDELQWDDSEYKLNTCKGITVRRNRLFLLSLQIVELYIKKYAAQIKFNLEKVYPEAWFQPFFRRDFKYDKEYVQYLKVMWETLFLCFPVVTTTLHAFDRKKFPMIQGIFDTLLIDEAGQALIHTAVGPLFRFRRAVIVGDVFQLEPIRTITQNTTIDKIDLPIQVKENIDIEKNSVQNAADLGSEIFDVLHGQNVGIVLEEHRRCENAIVQFSNQYVYDNCLRIVKQDEKKDFLEQNFCMIDIRGVKNAGNQNESEAEVCAKIVESLVQIYGNDYKEKIGIITPFKGQERLLKEKIPDVESGTVHVFQGQEKEVIVMSLVVDNTSQKSGIYFVGNTPNFLNVAFTRAKQQLILVGNYEACCMSDNYLSKAMECLKKYGRLYSLYEPEVMEKEQVEEIYLKQFWNLVSYGQNEKLVYQELLEKYAPNKMIVGAHTHHEFLEEILSCFPKSVKIVCPWITASVVNQKFLQYIQTIKQQQKIIKVCFGYHKTGYSINEIDKIVNRDCFGNQKEKHQKAIEELKVILKEDLCYCPPLHSKILIIDDEFMIISSHNWLSNSAQATYAKDEVGCLICDKSAIKFINKRYKMQTEEK